MINEMGYQERFKEADRIWVEPWREAETSGEGDIVGREERSVTQESTIKLVWAWTCPFLTTLTKARLGAHHLDNFLLC